MRKDRLGVPPNIGAHLNLTLRRSQMQMERDDSPEEDTEMSWTDVAAALHADEPANRASQMRTRTRSRSRSPDAPIRSRPNSRPVPAPSVTREQPAPRRANSARRREQSAPRRVSSARSTRDTRGRSA